MRRLQSTPILLAGGGSVIFAATLTLAISKAPLGSPVFFLTTAVAATMYILALRHVWGLAEATPRMLLLALAFAVAIRAPLAAIPVDRSNDMVRYLWDGRVQRLGYNPYLVVPSDPAMASTHTDETRQMPSRNARTPYPPAAQLFFRLVSSLHESTFAMKLALLACDLLTILVLWRWLAVTGRNEWLALAYAWNPLVILEVAHGGHIDALGALWIAASAYWLARHKRMLATIAFVLAVATKLLPIVLAPLLWRRIRFRDAVAGAAVLAALYLPFTYGTELPLGAVPNVVAHIRFNGPIFRAISELAAPRAAAAMAVMVGLVAAAWARRRLPPHEPAAWAWPMALALAAAPVVYPWYLLYITPFLFSALSAPLIAWTFSVIPVYLVWAVSRHGGIWVVPAWLEAIEYGVLGLAALASFARLRAKTPSVPEELG
jgi:alpha-1,6-mannosyltransferase